MENMSRTKILVGNEIGMRMSKIIAYAMKLHIFYLSDKQILNKRKNNFFLQSVICYKNAVIDD